MTYLIALFAEAVDATVTVADTITNVKNIIPSSMPDIIIAILASSTLTALLQHIMSIKSNKVALRRNKQQQKQEEIVLDTQLQKYYKEQYEAVLVELELLRKEVNSLRNKLKSQAALRKENITLKKKETEACKAVDCKNKIVKQVKQVKVEVK